MRIVQKNNRKVTLVYEELPTKSVYNLLLMSDLHIDSVYCNRELLTKHLNMAKKDDMKVIINGDLFDAMQGRYDPRRSAKELKAIYKDDAYFDTLVADATRFLMPYKEQIVLMAYGNHEEGVIRNSGTDILRRVADELGVTVGGYKGFIRFLFRREGGGGGRNSFTIHYNHGTSGSAPVTKGMLESFRSLVTVRDADLLIYGHLHTNYIHYDTVEGLTNSGNLVYNKIASVRLPSYQGLTPFQERVSNSLPLNGCVQVRIEYENGVVDYNLIEHFENPKPQEV